MTTGDAALERRLFPGGSPASDERTTQSLLDQYRLLVESSERVVARRQTANTFFLSINSALLIFAGVLLREGDAFALVGGAATAGLGLMGFFICFVWWRMVTSFRQLNTAKFQIIHLLERYLPAAVFEAEWSALGEGHDPSLYRPFTRLETRIPVALMALYGVAALIGVLMALASGLR
ncbi:MAG: hypothetical protein F4X26_10675 [Chloroflexi bacterium]|nr:hypothetical protein [Chloroflexota bacterium]